MTLWLLGLITGIFIHAGWTHRQVRKDLCILAYLQEYGPSLGLDMVRQGLGHRGTIYVRLWRLEEKGLVCEVAQAQGRSVYHITEAGRCALVAECASEARKLEGGQ